MRRLIPLLLTAVLTFVAVWLFMTGWGDVQQVSFDEDGNGTEAAQRDPLDHVHPRRTRGGTTVTEERIDDPATPEPSHGELVIRTSPPGSHRGLKVVTAPPLDEPALTETGFAHDLVPPASYDLTLWGGDVIPVTRRGVAVKAGHRTVVDVDVVRGIRPRGRLLHARDNRPISGALIDFNGYARVVTDAAGAFAVEPLIPREALRKIAISGDQIDDQVYRDLVVADHGDMTLYLGGDDGVIVGELVNVSGRPMPERFVVKVTIEPLFQVRRELEVVGSTAFRIENLYLTRYRVEIHFPEGEFPTQRKLVRVPPDTKEAMVRFELHRGGTLKGRFVGPDALIPATRLELRDGRNQVIAQCGAGEDGSYLIAGLEPGRYHPCVIVGKNGPKFMHPLEVPEGEVVIDRDLDVLRGRFVER